jgi:hypothetical protein
VLALAEHVGRTGKVDVLDAWRDAVKSRGSMEPWHDFARLILEPRPPAEGCTETMALRTRGFYLVAARLPAQLVIRALTAHFHEVTLLLNAVSDERMRRDLVAVGGNRRSWPGAADVDLGDFPGAHARTEFDHCGELVRGLGLPAVLDRSIAAREPFSSSALMASAYCVCSTRSTDDLRHWV